MLLARGARRVYAVDVGHGQLLPRLAQDPRVEVLDRTNLRTLASLPEPVHLATLDLSFISLRLVLEPVRNLLAPGGRVVALVKPQFEAGPREAPRGVVRDPDVRRAAVDRVAAHAAELGLAVRGEVESALPGPAGNREIFLHLVPA